MPKTIHISWDNIFEKLYEYDNEKNIVYGIPKGGMIAAGYLRKAQVTHNPSKANLFLDDIIDSGRTKAYYEDKFPNTKFVALMDKRLLNNLPWIVLPWEKDHPNGVDNIHSNIVRQLQYIGEDPTREGLLETPDRIVRAWDELFHGYTQSPEDIFTKFDDSDGYDQIVLLKDIEVYSMCEHHILPFFGKAHVAYIPNGPVVGISKLARLVDMYARRMQIQERIGQQVTRALMDFVKPAGAICIIEALHLCMRMRGCSKQQSTMVTSSVTGVFLEDAHLETKVLTMIYGGRT